MQTSSKQWLLCRLGGRLCAIPLDIVVETMRMLPVEPVAGAADFIEGVSIVRGLPLPIVNGAALFGDADTPHGRLVTIAVGQGAGQRVVGLAVDAVIAVAAIGDDQLADLPPLLRDAAGDIVEAIGLHDGEFLLRLEASRLLPAAMLAELGVPGPVA